LISCEFDFQIDKKITVDEFIIEELKSFNWNEVDQYPVFESCLKIEDIDNKNDCFVETITEAFRQNLANNNLVINRTLVDTVGMVLKVNKLGEISIQNITISDENTGYAKVITESFENTVLSLPKLFPAIKRGQEVDVIFNIPIIISTENE
tara:strand:- start:6338 stop:6790 length:453 start_codon:yes stop_codon:yes gene_type:complete